MNGTPVGVDVHEPFCATHDGVGIVEMSSCWFGHTVFGIVPSNRQLIGFKWV